METANPRLSHMETYEAPIQSRREPTLSLEGLRDLLKALEDDIAAVGGFAPFWADVLRQEIEERIEEGHDGE